MDVIDASASPTANAGPQTPKSAKNAKKRGRWALGAESAVGEFSKRARHSLSTLCTLRNSPAKKQTPRGEHCDISNMTAAELHAELEAMAQQENEQMQRASAASFMSPSKLSAPVSSPVASPLTRSLANDEQQTASPSKQSFKPSARAGIPKRNTPVQARQFRKTPSAMDFSTLQESSTPTSNAGSIASRTRSRARGSRDEQQPAPETPSASDRMASLRGVATASAASLVSRTSSITLSLRSVANNVSNTDLSQLLTPRTLNALKEVSGSVRIKRNKLMDDIRNISDSLRRRAGDDLDLVDDAASASSATLVGPRHLFGQPLHVVMQRQQAFAHGLAPDAEPYEVAAAAEHLLDPELASLEVPAVLHYASELIRERYLHSVGLFRLSAAHAVINQVASAIDSSTDSGKAEILAQRDANVIACIVKKWLRELPAPLLCPADKWLAIADSVGSLTDVVSSEAQQEEHASDESPIVPVLREAIAGLPEHNRNVLREILVLAKALSLNAHVNKMTTCNLATVIAPNLLYSSDPFFSSANITVVNTLVETIMNHADLLFPERMAQINFVVLPSPNSSSSVCEPALAAEQQQQQPEEPSQPVETIEPEAPVEPSNE